MYSLLYIKNSAICKNCKEELISYHFHDSKTCLCGNLTLSGGSRYPKIKVINPDLGYIKETILDDNTHELRREHLCFDINNDINNPNFIKIKDLTDSQLLQILKIKDFYDIALKFNYFTCKREINYRKNLKNEKQQV